MKIELAKRLSRVQESATLKMATATREARAKGNPVINFSVGEPNFNIPLPVQKTAIRAIEENFSKYPPVPGIPELRERIAKKLKEENGLSYTANQVIVTLGAKQAIHNFLMAVVEEGDEVIIPCPYWTSYPEIVKLMGADPVLIPTEEKKDFKLTPELLKKNISPRAKVLILNSPSNPTGTVYTKQELVNLAKVLEGTNVLVCSDEIYERLIFNSVPFTSFGSVSEDALSRTVTVNGFSKIYAMTGWRLGYAAGPKTIIDAMQVVQGQCTSGANSVAQKAGVTALDVTPAELKPVVDGLLKCRDQMVGIFSECKLVSFPVPQGAFYLFLNISKVLGKKDSSGAVVRTSEDLSLYLLKEAFVGTVPGGGFGEDSYIRLSFAASEKEIADGSRRIIKALEQLK